jgi:acetolactate synthase-1/2/3 large subunit
MKVAQAIAKTLKEYDTEYFFLLTGGDQSLWISLREVGIKMLLFRSEQAATYAADGYSRVSGKVSFVYGQYGPGVPNVVSGLPEPYWALSPVVSLTTSTRTLTKDKYEYQEIDQIPMHYSLTKFNKQVIRPDRTPDLLRAAIRASTVPPSGPSHLEIPSDLLDVEIGDVPIYKEKSFGKVPSLRVAPEKDLVKIATDILLDAKRPIILAGIGVKWSEAWNELKELAEYLKIPVATTLGGKGSISDYNPLSIGVIGRYSRKSANDIVQESDTILAIGTRLGPFETDTYRLIPRDAKIIHVDIDPMVLGSNYREEVSIYADAKLFLVELLEEVKKRTKMRDMSNWTKFAIETTNKWKESFINIASSSSNSPIHPAAIFAILNEILPNDSVVVADTGYMAAWSGSLYLIKEPGRNFLRANGSLGWAFPASIGAALAAKDKNVICIIGDGGIGYHISEIETLIRLKINNVKILILNNRSLAFEYHDQKYRYGTVVPEVNDFIDVNYAEVAKAFGIRGIRIQDKSELKNNFINALSYEGPVLLDIIVDKEISAPVTIYERALGGRVL